MTASYLVALAEAIGLNFNCDARKQLNEINNLQKEKAATKAKILRLVKSLGLVRTRSGSPGAGGGTGWFYYADPQRKYEPDYFNYSEPPPNYGLVRARFINTVWNFELRGNAVWVAPCEMESIGL